MLATFAKYGQAPDLFFGTLSVLTALLTAWALKTRRQVNSSPASIL
ncbi:hypothetical protein DSOL_0884 [Desulfosporosinus metallidurans]|uniref:Uncharacterized protein n=1 Tax=Desulfosporosinus metallidurans TaxID=1888891 RepID=A0A1Q8R0N8_9FIRM|nr:hypothetical protein DSOL_0884 [Desulfosporosinus metallidurans]